LEIWCISVMAVYLKGPPLPGTSACRAQRIEEALGATLLGLGLGLSRLRGLDRFFPLCFSGWRLTRVVDLSGSACHVLQAGDRLELNAARIAAPDGDPAGRCDRSLATTPTGAGREGRQ
jgi:hypothetical protein